MARGGYIGYTFQKHVTQLFLTKMDVEREIEVVEIEALGTNDNFDDLIITVKNNKYQLQIKDLKDIVVEKLSILEGQISINGTKHIPSENTNIVFFNSIQLEPNSDIFGIPSFLTSNVHLISLNREQIDDKIKDIYKLDPFRKSIIDKFFSKCLDNRKWIIKREDLPNVDSFGTNLLEPTIINL